MKLGNLVIIGVLAAAAACGGDGNELPAADRLIIVTETDAQTAFAGARLALPLAVSVTDAQGITVPRAEVQWTVTQGDGATLSDAVTVSDGTGRAEVAVTLGPTAGGYAVQARLVVKPEAAVSFSMTAVQPPQLTGLSPSTFAGGDTVTLQGADLADSLLVEIGGTLARVLSAASDGTSLDAVAPECLVPGPVTVALLYAGATLDEVSGDYQASAVPLRLEAGEYASFAPAALDNCAVFPDAGPAGALYLLAPQSAASVAGLQADYRLDGSAAPAVPAAPPERAAAEVPHHVRFHDFLRQREAEIARLPKPALEPRFLAPAAVAAGIVVGDQDEFRVCGALPCAVEDFETVTAVARYVGERVAVYEDVNAPSPLSDQEFQDFGSLFDDDLYDIATSSFGAESDVDQNGLVFILMTPVVNQLTDAGDCDSGVITGFFFATDIDPAFANDSRSNQAEIMYAMVPDPSGTVTCQITKDHVDRLVPTTFSHEMQHMINYTQHVLVRGGISELLWLNEGLSHISEELAAFYFDALGDQERFSSFAIGNVFNAYLYLQAPGDNFVLFGAGTGTLAERGAAWVFLRWVVDQFGDAVIRRMVETTLTGANNVAAAAGEPFSRLLSEWFLANYVSDLPGFTAPPRLQYTSWAFRTTYGSLHDQAPDRFPDPFPLVPPLFVGATFSASGTLRSGSGGYYLIEQLAGQQGFTVAFEDPLGGPVSETVTPRLEVVRIR